MARGGRRAGAPGKQYSNRTDMALGPRKVPITAVPGQPYGDAGAQIAAQRAVPMANAALPTPAATPPVAGQGGPVPPQAGPPNLPGGSALPPGSALPGSLPPFTAPTVRPGEHVMTGVNAGPGEGSTAMPVNPMQPAPASPQTTAQFLQHLASQPGAPSGIMSLAAVANRGG